MSEQVIKFFESIFKNSPELITFVIASLPIVELRGAIPVAILNYGFSLPKTFAISVIGNLVPVIPVLFFLNYLTEKLSKIKLFGKFFNWWFERTRKRSELIEKYEALGLAIFVAIPLPFTGAWTGCAAAYIFRIKFRYAFPAIVCGVLIAGIVVTATTVGIDRVIRFF
ncbi:MAG: small multi-drug export protein [Elusimicrobiota bacterium]|nr:small multi-drug export protein [Elusimicrobiota bacterium]